MTIIEEETRRRMSRRITLLASLQSYARVRAGKKTCVCEAYDCDLRTAPPIHEFWRDGDSFFEQAMEGHIAKVEIMEAHNQPAVNSPGSYSPTTDTGI
eukprot:2357253-Amphidinium_carterae.2